MNIRYLNLFSSINYAYDNSNSNVFNFILIQNTKFWFKRKYSSVLFNKLPKLPNYPITQSPNLQVQPPHKQAVSTSSPSSKETESAIEHSHPRTLDSIPAPIHKWKLTTFAQID